MITEAKTNDKVSMPWHLGTHSEVMNKEFH